ncbi:TetR/AcrR family transcriptional regulator [Mycolicibacterium helvum]|uniref:TetR/AcrR family transcriptional regulator n=1 Tax=Mycolicibacterium helvum TaxID=1534349 RepID=UPI001FE6FDBF|nr:TetR/AcrR family transcriptional regulator [Mycolicibacterium helvum]
MFTEYGYARGTTNRIAEWADVSIGSLYQYYPNKDAIVVELAARHLDAGIAAANRLRDGEGPASVASVMHAVITTAIDNHRQNPEFLRVLAEEASRSKELMDKVAELRGSSVEDMHQLLTQHPEVTVEDKDTAARLVVTTIELVVHHALAAPAPVETTRFGNELVAMLTTYLTADRDLEDPR